MPIRSSYAQTIGQDRLPGRGQSINDSEVSVKPVAIHARLKAIASKEGYEDGPYNSKYSQQHADAYGQIVNLFDITSVDAQNQQQVKDTMINYFLVTKGVDRQTAESYTETKQGLEIIATSVTPILGSAAAKQLSKVVDANLKVVAKGNVDGVKFSDTNQGIRRSQLGKVRISRSFLPKLTR